MPADDSPSRAPRARRRKRRGASARLLLSSLLLRAMVTGMQSTTAAESAADAAFHREFGEAFFDRFWQLNPDWAIAAGYYKYADRLVVPDEKARAAQLEQDERWLKALRRIDPKQLSPNVRADWAILVNAFESDRWSLTELRSWQWNPSNYNVADPFALLATLEYAPLEQRLRSILARLEKVPAYYAAAKRNVANPTREHLQLAIEQNRGALDVFGKDLERQVAAAKLTSAEREQFSRRLGAARAAIEDYVSWLTALDARLASGAEPARSFRLGRELYDRKFELEIQSGETAERLYARALEEKERLLTRMALLADLLWPKYFPNAVPPDDRFERIGRVIAKLSEHHVPPEQLVAA